jgi:hypothetical protein
MPAPRIDTLRAQITATITLLESARAQLDTLHELAYDRAVAAEHQRTSGGQADYALDRHGDPKARAAYVELGKMVIHVCGHIATKVHPAVKLLADPDATRDDKPQSISPRDWADVTAAQARRIARGEFDPGRVVAQPEPSKWRKSTSGKINALELELRQARAELDRRARRIQRLEKRVAAERARRRP